MRDCLQAASGRALILSSHHANWEWLLARCSSEFNEPLTAAYKPTRRESVDGVLRRMRERFGCTMVKAKDLVPHLLEQRGKVRLLAMLADQSPSAKSEQQTWLEFFGQPTSFFRGPGWIGAKLGYSVYLAAMHRERRGQYVVRFIELSRAGARTEPDQILTAYTRALESTCGTIPSSISGPTTAGSARSRSMVETTTSATAAGLTRESFGLRLRYACSWLLFFLGYRLFGLRRGTIRQNLRRSFPDKSDAERERIRNEFRHSAIGDPRRARLLARHDGR